jgi:hypothetical protein
MRSLAIGFALCCIACQSSTEPRGLAGTYVLVSVYGYPLPDSIGHVGAQVDFITSGSMILRNDGFYVSMTRDSSYCASCSPSSFITADTTGGQWRASAASLVTFTDTSAMISQLVSIESGQFTLGVMTYRRQ